MTAPIIVRGHPSDAELAALTGVLIALRAQADAAPDDASDRPTQGWTSRRQQLRLPPAPGPGAWRASSRL